MFTSESLLLWLAAVFGAAALCCFIISGMAGQSIRQLVSGKDSLTPKEEQERAVLFEREDSWLGASVLALLIAGIFFFIWLFSR